MSSHQPARPSDGALRTALQAMMTYSQPPPLVPHPPIKNIAWRTRRIVNELNALVNLDELLSYETELRGLMGVQEIRCRAKLVNHAYRDECALREVAELLSAEAAERCELTKQYDAITLSPYKVVHLFLQEESARRLLRCGQRASWRALLGRSQASRFLLAEAADRAVLGALEECSRKELKNRRVIELGNRLQREIVLQSRLSGHLQCVEHSRNIKGARRRLALQEEENRFAVERLYSLHLMLLLQDAKIDFSAVIQRDVMMLSETNRANLKQADVAKSENGARACFDQEQRLRFMVVEQEHKSFQSLTQAFLLGWRTVYNQITRDSDSTSVVRKVELVARRDIMDRQRLDFNALLLQCQAQMSVLARHHTQRRILCQHYIDGARAISCEENRRANDLFSAHYVWQREQAALNVTTVLSIEEVAARYTIRGAEAQARLTFKLQYLFELLQVQCQEARRFLAEEEARCFDVLQELHVHIFFTESAARLVMSERAQRTFIERDELAEAVDTFLLHRQVLAHSFVSDACRPLSLLEDGFRSRVTIEEAREWNSLVHQQVVLSEVGQRMCLLERERSQRQRHIAAFVAGLEADARRRLCASAEAEMFQTRQDVLKCLEREGRTSLCECEVLVRENLLFTDLPPADPWRWRFSELTDAWVELEAEWGDAASDTHAWPSDWPPLGLSSLACYSALRCEDVLVDAYLERDLIHFVEHREWLCLLQQAGNTDSAPGSDLAAQSSWKLHSLSMHLEPQRRASFINAWHSNQSFDVSVPLTQLSDEAIVGEHTVSFYAPDPGATAALMQRDNGTGVVFFLIFDDEGTVLACATMVVETVPTCSTHLCIPLENSKGFIRLV
ncbi:hypothetical protein JKF63_00009 [Porcisia hertigi]|uniref:Uncharacterized protein n=1 Tax=Porcisia hertigi TaxID=2761500 RepID=A0A836KXY3_9TRYP|nr:hypothetical protein JKF63_00009 [Porcisia hertigi]